METIISQDKEAKRVKPLGQPVPPPPPSPTSPLTDCDRAFAFLLATTTLTQPEAYLRAYQPGQMTSAALCKASNRKRQVPAIIDEVERVKRMYQADQATTILTRQEALVALSQIARSEAVAARDRIDSINLAIKLQGTDKPPANEGQSMQDLAMSAGGSQLLALGKSLIQNPETVLGGTD